jgi:hypothetical protein
MAEKTIHLDINGDIWIVTEDEPSIMEQLYPERAIPKHYIGRLIGSNFSTVLDQTRMALMTQLVLIRASDVPPGALIVPLRH